MATRSYPSKNRRVPRVDKTRQSHVDDIHDPHFNRARRGRSDEEVFRARRNDYGANPQPVDEMPDEGEAYPVYPAVIRPG